jgi:hypothetical protein
VTVALASLAGCCISTISLADEPPRTKTDETVAVQVPTDSPAGRFGLKHELTLASDAGFSVANTSVSGHSGSTTTFTMSPAVDFFIIDDLSLGGTFEVDYSHLPDGSHSTTFSIGPRAGYNFSLSEKFSIWPKVGLAYATTSFSPGDSTINGGGGTVTTISTTTSNSGLRLNLYVPFMFHPVAHFFLGLGPALDVDLTGDAKATTIAGRLTIGGWLGPLAVHK